MDRACKALAALSFLLSYSFHSIQGSETVGSRIYFFVGAIDEMSHWEKDPFQPRNWFTRTILDAGYNRNRFDAAEVQDGIWESVRELTAKNYELIHQQRVSVADITAAISDPKALAIFYKGHGVNMKLMQAKNLLPTIEGSPVDDRPNENAETRSYLTVFENDRGALMTPQRIAEAKNARGPEFQISPNLQLIFLGACHAKQAKTLLRSAFNLSKTVQVISPVDSAGNEIEGETNLPEISDTFRDIIAPWVKQLPTLPAARSPAPVPVPVIIGY